MPLLPAPRLRRIAEFVVFLLFLLLPPLHAATGGSISGVVTDATGAVLPGAALTLTNPAQKTVYRTVADKQGFYSFPNLPVGRYDLTVFARGFTTERRTNLTVDTDAALRVDASVTVGSRADAVTVTSDAGVQVEAISTHLGEVVSAAQMTALPLNGRSYTDLLAIQPGVAPISTLLPSSVIMAGVTGSLDPSGDLNPGNLSIHGQRESPNGFLVNGIDVQEHMNGGTAAGSARGEVQLLRTWSCRTGPLRAGRSLRDLRMLRVASRRSARKPWRPTGALREA